MRDIEKQGNINVSDNFKISSDQIFSMSELSLEIINISEIAPKSFVRLFKKKNIITNCS